MPQPAFRFIRPLLASAAALLVLPPIPVHAATFVWDNTSGVWSDAARWGGAAPTGTNPADVLVFGGDVATAPYTALNDIAFPLTPFQLNQFVLQASDSTASGADHFLASNGVVLSGAGAGILQNGVGNFTFNLPIQLGNSITVGGTGTGTVTLNAAVSGTADIVKNGPGTLRFGTPFTSPATGPSPNTWFGSLTINGGIVRFNNNAQAGPTALRANPVTMSAGTSLLFSPKAGDPASSLRLGTLNGNGLVQARGQLNSGSQDSEDITIWAFTDGTYAGIFSNTKVGSESSGHSSGEVTVRGTGTQTFTGSLDIEKDVAIGTGATLVYTGNASTGAQASGALLMQGGTFKLDNTTTNNSNRLRDGASGSTGIDVLGGGTFTFIGNVSGTTETVGRLQLGSGSTPRSGALTIEVKHNTSASAPTLLNFQSYSRDQTPVPLDTVNFSATDTNGNVLPLGVAGNNPQIFFSTTLGSNFIVPLFNGLLGNTGSNDATTLGWATVNGSDFASYGATGIIAVGTTAALPGTTTGDATANMLFNGSATLGNLGGYSANSIKLAPSGAGQSLNLATTGNLNTGAILLAGNTDFAITGTGGGGISNAGPRYFQVQQAVLTLDASLGASNTPVVKAGAGTLVLTNPTNLGVTQPFVINAGVVRAQPGSSLPFGELRLRGGVLEITGGGTLMRSLGLGPGNLTWSGISAAGTRINEERGSGGFAAFGADATVDLNGVGASDLTWEGLGFVDSGYALILGSRTANARITFADNINLTQTPPASNPPAPNYNAREIRVIDNPGSSSDRARITGALSGSLQNDLLKTGDGLLELTGINTYAGATLIHEGILAVNGTTVRSFLTDVQFSAQLIGNGTTGPIRVENGGTLAPGDALGHTSILSAGDPQNNFPGDLTFVGPGAKLAIEIGGLTPGGDGTTGYDLLNINGRVILNGAGLQLASLGGFTVSANQVFFIVNNDGSDPVSGTFAQGASVVFGGQTLMISYEADFDSNSFTGGNDIAVALVPEPAGAAFVAVAALGLAARRRRL